MGKNSVELRVVSAPLKLPCCWRGFRHNFNGAYFKCVLLTDCSPLFTVRIAIMWSSKTWQHLHKMMRNECKYLRVFSSVSKVVLEIMYSWKKKRQWSLPLKAYNMNVKNGHGQKSKKELDCINQCAWQEPNSQDSQEKSEQVSYKGNSGGRKMKFGAVYKKFTSNMSAEWVKAKIQRGTKEECIQAFTCSD